MFGRNRQRGNKMSEQRTEPYITESARKWRDNLIQQGYEKGFVKGFLKGYEFGIKKRQREGLEKLSQFVISKLENRFGPLPEVLAAAIKAAPSVETLGKLVCLSVRANSLDDFSIRMQTA